MEDTLNRIRSAREAIWFVEPGEVARLVQIKATGNQAASTVLYATTKLATLITFLNHMRGMARGGGVDLQTMVAVTVPYLDFHAGVFGNFYKLADTAQVVRWAGQALPEAQSLGEYAALLEELAIYLNRIDYWIDFKIPWAAFGRTFEYELSAAEG
jgi:hypothetical protein